MKQRSGSSSLSALKLKSFSSLVKWWARIIHVTWKVTYLYGLCVNARTYPGKSLAVWMQQIWRSGDKCRNTLPVYFPESLCERGLSEFLLRTSKIICQCGKKDNLISNRKQDYLAYREMFNIYNTVIDHTHWPYMTSVVWLYENTWRKIALKTFFYSEIAGTVNFTNIYRVASSMKF